MKKIAKELLAYDRVLGQYPLYGACRKYVIFILGGGTGLLLALGITAFFTEFFKIHYTISYLAGIVAAVIFTFFYHRHVTFGNKTMMKRRFMRFGTLVIILGIVNYASVYITTEALVKLMPNFRFQYLIAIFFVTLFFSVVNFSMNKIWVFKEHKRDSSLPA